MGPGMRPMRNLCDQAGLMLYSVQPQTRPWPWAYGNAESTATLDRQDSAGPEGQLEPYGFLPGRALRQLEREDCQTAPQEVHRGALKSYLRIVIRPIKGLKRD